MPGGRLREAPAARPSRRDGRTGWLTARRLTYPAHSGYDAFAAAADATHLIDEHYRCHPDIGQVPNREVYQRRLTALTDPARLAAATDPAVRWRHVPGEFSRGATGSGFNQVEIDAVVAEVTDLRTGYPDVSIGTVTPLAAHSLAMDDVADGERRDRRVRVGSAIPSVVETAEWLSLATRS